NPRQSSQKERVELTILSRGPAIRAEAAAEDRLAALDLALAKLDSRLRRALDRRKHRHGTGAGATTGASAGAQGGTRAGAKSGVLDAASVPVTPQARRDESEAAQAGLAETMPEEDAPAHGDSVVPIEMQGDGPLVIRQKFHHAKPISIDQALLEMELVGHDFYLFHDIEEDTPSVVYRRRGYQYGVIRLIENPAEPSSASESSPADLGARIPRRRRADQDQASREGAIRRGASPTLQPGW